ncbi:MAG: zeta toxin family protein [Dysgonamonadaceae bacterium]|jgi:hypothetical protein|nr:zeta toxin family protein [Dysgonamonadaceae bacterium]
MILPDCEVREIFESQKYRLLCSCKTDNNPTAVILGGQPACGKSNLTIRIKQENPSKSFLTINGDLYREYHPGGNWMKKNDTENYSTKTQNFSNIFTEKLIEEAIRNKFNVIVEGTMRKMNVPINTARNFKRNGFDVQAFVIAVHPIITELGIYRRYLEEMKIIGAGRLSDINSHNDAVNGLLISVNELYTNDLADVHIYNYLAEKHVLSFKLSEQISTNNLPNRIIEAERANNLLNKDMLEEHIHKGKKTLKEIDENLKPKVSKIISQLEFFRKNLQKKAGLSM